MTILRGRKCIIGGVKHLPCIPGTTGDFGLDLIDIATMLHKRDYQIGLGRQFKIASLLRCTRNESYEVEYILSRHAREEDDPSLLTHQVMLLCLAALQIAETR